MTVLSRTRLVVGGVALAVSCAALAANRILTARVGQTTAGMEFFRQRVDVLKTGGLDPWPDPVFQVALPVHASYCAGRRFPFRRTLLPGIAAALRQRSPWSELAHSTPFEAAFADTMMACSALGLRCHGQIGGGYFIREADRCFFVGNARY